MVLARGQNHARSQVQCLFCRQRPSCTPASRVCHLLAPQVMGLPQPCPDGASYDCMAVGLAAGQAKHQRGPIGEPHCRAGPGLHWQQRRRAALGILAQRREILRPSGRSRTRGPTRQQEQLPAGRRQAPGRHGGLCQPGTGGQVPGHRPPGAGSRRQGLPRQGAAVWREGHEAGPQRRGRSGRCAGCTSCRPGSSPSLPADAQADAGHTLAHGGPLQLCNRLRQLQRAIPAKRQLLAAEGPAHGAAQGESPAQAAHARCAAPLWRAPRHVALTAVRSCRHRTRARRSSASWCAPS